MGTCKPHKVISLGYQPMHTWGRQKVRIQFAIAMQFLCTFLRAFWVVWVLNEGNWLDRHHISDLSALTLMPAEWFKWTGYAWVGFQYAKCKHDVLHRQVRVNKLDLGMCSCSVCVVFVIHCCSTLVWEDCRNNVFFQVLQVTAQTISA